MKLRYYQQDSITAIWDYFRNGGTGNPVVAAPTGTGKSVIIGAFIQQAYAAYSDQRVMMLTHVKELIEQNFEKLTILWPSAPAGIYSAGVGRRELDKRVTFAGIQSVAKKAALFGHIDLIMIDECHLVSPKNNTAYMAFINALLKVNPSLKVIGFSATPYRLGLGHIIEGGLFTDVCYDITDMKGFNRLLAEGFLANLVPKRTATEIDLTGVKLVGGEFQAKSLDAAVNRDEITLKALQEVLECSHGREHWLVFATGVEHAETIADMLEQFGVPAAAVHSRLPKAENTRRINDFKAGKIKALVNNNKLTTGFDFPGIDLIVMLRPTNSPALWVQMLGRGTRPVYADGYDLSTIEGRIAAIEASEKQDCLVMDFAGNTKRLGPVNDPVLPKKKGKGKRPAPVKLCEECHTYCHSSVRKCGECGWEFPIGVRFKEISATAALIAQPELPKIVDVPVNKVVYQIHKKQDKPDSIKVTYYSGIKRYTNYVCLEHEGYAGKRARLWWGLHDLNKMGIPPTTALAFEKCTYLAQPTHIKIWINKKYPEIMDYIFGGPVDGNFNFSTED